MLPPARPSNGMERNLANRARVVFGTILLIASSGALADSQQDDAHCALDEGVTLQVLGSGGPIADDGRASAAYLVWIDGQSRVMIDAGTGSVLRFAESGARFEDLEFVGLSHFHTDHSADFPALLKSGNFSQRTRSITVAGPRGNSRFPGLGEWLEQLFDADDGAYRYLSGFLAGGRGYAPLSAFGVPIDAKRPARVYDNEALSLRVEALPVPHGIVPALGFRVTAGEHVLVFGSDQTMTSEAFIDFARDADVLVAHLAIPEGASGTATQLHATPGAIGATASEAGVDALLLSHFMARSLARLDDNRSAVEARYEGRILLAEDLACVALK